ncbi:MAG: Flp family type IVb pilin [Anaerolineae bacterium]|nr:Flp family type IVb pilin [Anaerolineae bacterium]
MRKRDLFHKKGQGLVEYALILALIAIVSIVALSLLGTSVSDVFSQITEALSGDGGGGGGDGQPPPGGTCYGSLLLPYLIGSTTLFLLIFRPGPQRSTAVMGV